jgi:hypothetical protein
VTSVRYRTLTRSEFLIWIPASCTKARVRHLVPLSSKPSNSCAAFTRSPVTVNTSSHYSAIRLPCISRGVKAQHRFPFAAQQHLTWLLLVRHHEGNGLLFF